MAAQQPNMEALQKVARRRRGTGGNQDMIRKINDLHKKWQKLWLGATDRHRVLTDARMRLKDVSNYCTVKHLLLMTTLVTRTLSPVKQPLNYLLSQFTKCSYNIATFHCAVVQHRHVYCVKCQGTCHTKYECLC